MKLLGKLGLSFVANIIALILADYLILGFMLAGATKELLMLALVLMVINIFIRPLIKLILSPLIILSLGLFTILINAGILYVVDIYSQNITISGLIPLLLTTILISAVNIFINFFAKLSK